MFRKLTMRQPKKCAFTLVELLVVVSVIAALAGLLLPALHKAQAKARLAGCEGNLREMGVAMELYLHDFGKFPGHYFVPGKEIVYPKRLLPYAGGIGIWNCPAERGAFYWTNDPATSRPITIHPAITGFCYGYNGMGGGPDFALPYCGLGGDLDPAGGNPWNAEQAESVVKVPADMICIADTVSDNNWDTSIEPEVETEDGVRSDENPEWPGNRHNGGAAFLYVDSHVEFHRQSNAVSRTPAWRRKWNSDHEPHL